MGIKGTVRRNQDGDFIHANVDLDIIITEEVVYIHTCTMHARGYVHTYIHTHTCMHIRTHTHTHTRTSPTHIHVHTYIYIQANTLYMYGTLHKNLCKLVAIHSQMFV